jgi:hypothetical protein
MGDDFYAFDPDDRTFVSLGDFESHITNERLATELLAYICPAGEPWTADTPEEDHGHTKCMWIGMAIKRLRQLP